MNLLLQCFDCDSTLAFKTVKALAEHVLDASHLVTDLWNKLIYRKQKYDQTKEHLQLKNQLDAGSRLDVVVPGGVKVSTGLGTGCFICS